MIKLKILVFFCLICATSGNAQSLKQKEYLIKGEIKGIDSGTIRMSNSNVLDSSIILNGKFSLKGSIGFPERMLFNISPGNWNFRAFVEDTTITLFIDTAGARHYGHGINKWALIWEIQETGSKLSDVYSKYTTETNVKNYSSVISSLNERLNSGKGNADVASHLEHEIDSVKTLALSGQKVWIENYINQYPASVAGVYLFNNFYESASTDISLAYLQSTLDKFSGLAKASVYYKQLYKAAADLALLQINKMALDFTLLKRDKTKFTLSSTRGGYTLIDFWASWCAPCRRAIPNWKKVYGKYHKKGFNIISVADDRNLSDWEQALVKEQMPWIQVIDNFPNKNEPAVVTELYGIKSIPYYVLIDKDGRIILSTNDESAIQRKIEEILK
ncbi:MAG TPA: TlpA disulfide reductase family protein [Hanamia sp.]